MINLFIDANIWLSLYDYKKDTLKEFEKLNTLLNSQIRLYVSEQVYNEVLRNRDGRIKEAWDRFTQKNLQLNNAPTFCRDYSEYSDFHKQYCELNNNYTKLIQKIDCDIRNHSLEADKLLTSLFNEIKKEDSTQDIIEMAELRSKTGNPPGKNDSIGDAINWELLLKKVPDGEDLYLISEDGDYSSRIDKKKLNLFLEKEWKNKKKSKIYFFTTLHDFLDNYAKTLESQHETSDSSDANKENEQLRKRIMRISESMKKEQKEIEEERQKGIFTESFNNLKFTDSAHLFAEILKYITMTNNTQTIINDFDLNLPKEGNNNDENQQ